MIWRVIEFMRFTGASTMRLGCNRCVWAGAALGVLSMFAGIANANEIFSEDFASNDGAVGSLDGTAEDTSGAIWAANGLLLPMAF